MAEEVRTLVDARPTQHVSGEAALCLENRCWQHDGLAYVSDCFGCRASFIQNQPPEYRITTPEPIRNWDDTKWEHCGDDNHYPYDHQDGRVKWCDICHLTWNHMPPLADLDARLELVKKINYLEVELGFGTQETRQDIFDEYVARVSEIIDHVQGGNVLSDSEVDALRKLSREALAGKREDPVTTARHVDRRDVSRKSTFWEKIQDFFS